MKERSKRKTAKTLLFLCLMYTMFMFSSCDKKIQTEQELKAYINDLQNGLKKEKEINGIQMSCTYHPLAVYSSKKQQQYTLTNKRLYFVLSISKDNRELLKQLDYNLYSEMVSILSFRMNQYINLQVPDKDPIEPLDCLFQQTYGMSNANTLILVFDRAAVDGTKSFNIQVKEFGLGLGNQRFEYNTKNLKSIDEIIL